MNADNELLHNRRIDARIFQQPLSELADTIAFKVQREGLEHALKPAFVAADIYILLRQAHRTYDLFCFINADESRKGVDWKAAYSVVILPLVRTMIDCLYNITAILQNPGVRGYRFRKSGYRKVLEALDADQKRYGGDPEWDTYIAWRRREIDLGIRSNDLTEAEVRAADIWPTLGKYLGGEKNTALTPHQEFLKKLTFGFWREYSGISHATFQGLLPFVIFLEPKDLRHEDRPKIETVLDDVIAIHIPRVAVLLLCMLTEVQACCSFDGARIDQRLHQVWNALLIAPEVKELYDERYAQLMKDKGICPD